MELKFIRKDYDYHNHNAEKASYFWAAYINDYRIFGMKPYGINPTYESFDIPDGVYDVEIWRTLRKRETDYRILWGFKINGTPVGKRKNIFKDYPENCLQKVHTFTADIKDVNLR